MLPPRRWSTDTNFSSGPDTGTPTRVDPGTGISAQGFIPHAGVPAQHVNALLGGITDYLSSRFYDPELFAHIREDFMPGAYDATAALLYCAHTWRVTEGSAYTQGPLTQPSGGINNPGVHFATIPSTDSYELHLGEEIIAGMVRWGDVEEMTLSFALVSSNFTGSEAFVGLASQLSDGGLGSNALGLYFDKATSDNWLLRATIGGSDDITDTTIPMVSTEFVVLKLKRTSATQVQVTVNGAGPFVLTDGTTAPADSAPLNVGLVATAGGSASLTPQWDLVDVIWSTANRAT